MTYDVSETSGSVLRLGISLSRSIWRLGPAWSLVAGSLLAGITSVDRLLPLAVALVLVDPVWGALRRLAPAPGVAVPGPAPSAPYSVPDAPMSRFVVALGPAAGGIHAARWPALVFWSAAALAGAVLLGPAALVFSLLAAALTGWSWLTFASGRGPGVADALLDVALPLLFGLTVAMGPGLPREPLANSELRQLGVAILLAAGFTLIQWGYLRRGRVAPWLGQGIALMVPVMTGSPATLAVVAALLLPPSLWLANPASVPALSNAQPWWLGSLIACAIGLSRA